MRIKFDKKKSEQLRNDPRRKIGFEEAQELFDDVFIEDQQIDYPHQWRATGWAQGELYTIVYEDRKDEAGNPLLSQCRLSFHRSIPQWSPVHQCYRKQPIPRPPHGSPLQSYRARRDGLIPSKWLYSEITRCTGSRRNVIICSTPNSGAYLLAGK